MSSTSPSDRTAVSRRGLLLGGAGAAAGLTALSGLAAAPASAATGSFRVATANIQHALSNTRFGEDMGRIGPRSDLIGLNEMYEADRRDAAVYWAVVNEFHLVHPGGTAGTNAIMARRSVFDHVTGDHSVFFSANTNGKRPPRPVHATWAKFTHIATQLPVIHIVTHLPPKIDRGGRPTAPDGRLDDVKKQLEAVWFAAALWRDQGCEVVVTGDMNVDYRNDTEVRAHRFPFHLLEGEKKTVPGLRSNYSLHGVKGRGTHPAGDWRHIDYIYEWRRAPRKRKIRMQDYSLIALNSDHHAVVAPFTINTKGGA